MPHPVERFLGIPYDAEAFDCADLAMLVLRELHGKYIVLPNGRPRGREGQSRLWELSQQYADPVVGEPQDGDVVLMKWRKRVGHVGLFYRIAGEQWVLHSNETNGVSVLHRVRELPMWGAKVVGFFRVRA